jgi:DNA polymerase-3 subunit epsilon
VPSASWIEGTLVGFDLETTGLDREVDEPVSYAFAVCEPSGLVAVDERFMLPTRAISRGASGVHGLTVARLHELGASSHDDGLRAIERRIGVLSAEGTPIVGANLAYDLTMVDRALGRLASPASLLSIGWDGPALDVLVIDRAMDADFAARPVRKLAALCEHYAISAELHTAGGDATAAVQILLAQAARFPVLAEMSLEELYGQQVLWHKEWCEEYSARRVAGGHRPLAVTESAWPYLERMTLF